MYISFVYISKEDSFLENTIDLAYIYIYIFKKESRIQRMPAISESIE